MLRRIGLIVLLYLWLLPAAAFAQPHDPQIEIDGLLLDQTKTRAGHFFFCRFSTLWEGPENAGDYNIMILENATPQWGSVVWIKVNDWVVFQSLLKPRDDDVKDLAAKAVEKVKEFVRFNLRDGEKIKEDDLAANGW